MNHFDINKCLFCFTLSLTDSGHPSLTFPRAGDTSFYFHLAWDKWCLRSLGGCLGAPLYIFSPWIHVVFGCQGFTSSWVNFHDSFLLRRGIWWMSIHVERTVVLSETCRRRGIITRTHKHTHTHKMVMYYRSHRVKGTRPCPGSPYVTDLVLILDFKQWRLSRDRFLLITNELSPKSIAK